MNLDFLASDLQKGGVFRRGELMVCFIPAPVGVSLDQVVVVQERMNYLAEIVLYGSWWLWTSPA